MLCSPGPATTLTPLAAWSGPAKASLELSRFKPVLNWANGCLPNILRTVRRTMIRFLIELLVRPTWFGQFDELYSVLNFVLSERAADSMINNVG